MIKRVCLVVKHKEDRPAEVAREIVAHLKTRDVQVNLGHISSEDQAVVVLGGDGTLLHVASMAFRADIPVLGINAGGLGFITEVHLDEMLEALDALIENTFTLDRRMVLQVVVKDSSSRVKREYLALNEAVITKGALSRIIQINSWVNGIFLTAYRGDGLIISTATGSTGYNLSAGGPIMYPGLESIVLTPICPFALSARPIILPGESEIRINVKETAEEVCLDVDGQAGLHLEKADEIEIRRMPGYLKLIKSPHRDYFTILREKLGWTRGMSYPGPGRKNKKAP